MSKNARNLVESGYYRKGVRSKSKNSLVKAIQESRNAAVIAEIKKASPSLGILRENLREVEVASAMKRGGAAGISVITEPNFFKGSLLSLANIQKEVDIPLLMKDVVVSTDQLEAAWTHGADAVLLIWKLFDRGLCSEDADDMIEYAHKIGLEVLLEVHTYEEFLSAIRTEADIIGINNRDLTTLRVDLDVTRRIMEKADANTRIIISESGIEKPADMLYLRRFGIRAFLIGSAIMRSSNIEEKVREFVEAFGNS
ncbi:MAG: indole-3-glycerol-phosphate synthase [Nitrososphaerota archaeon]|nr:indole-3-glycerol-phosphate synthase [Nitrososphaerota archaeon]